MTEIVVTGTGCPRVRAEQAGPGVLVRRGDTTLQFDAGRATSMRLIAAGVDPEDLTALFVTHHHSDHLLGLSDLLHTRWIHSQQRDNPLPVVIPQGPAVRLARGILEPWQEEIAIRNQHRGTRSEPRLDISTFAASPAAHTVWSDGVIEVDAFLVDHPPVVPSVGYRIRTPEGILVVSGDTKVCRAVFDAVGEGILVHEVVLHQAGREGLNGAVAAYHADAIELGRVAAAHDVRRLVLTHFVPAPTPGLRELFVDEVRSGGYSGELRAARDLDRFEIG